jgi:hypothetical protein
LMIERRLPRAKWKRRRKKFFVPVAGIDDPGRTNNSRIGITDADYSAPQLV